MFLKDMTLLSEYEYEKCESLIPVIDDAWWLKTAAHDTTNRVRVVFEAMTDPHCKTATLWCKLDGVGVRPCCVFEACTDDPVYWKKPALFLGSKIEFGKYKWTVFGVENSEFHALCDEIIANRRFDEETNAWEESELKHWLKNIGLYIIQEEK